MITVRVQQSSKKQEIYFGENAWRPFISINDNPNDPLDEKDIITIIKLIMNDKKIKAVKKFCKVDGGYFQYGYSQSGYVKDWYDLGFIQ